MRLALGMFSSLLIPVQCRRSLKAVQCRLIDLQVDIYSDSFETQEQLAAELCRVDSSQRLLPCKVSPAFVSQIYVKSGCRGADVLRCLWAASSIRQAFEWPTEKKHELQSKILKRWIT